MINTHHHRRPPPLERLPERLRRTSGAAARHAASFARLATFADNFARRVGGERMGKEYWARIDTRVPVSTQMCSLGLRFADFLISQLQLRISEGAQF